MSVLHLLLVCHVMPLKVSLTTLRLPPASALMEITLTTISASSASLARLNFVLLALLLGLQSALIVLLVPLSILSTVYAPVQLVSSRLMPLVRDAQQDALLAQSELPVTHVPMLIGISTTTARVSLDSLMLESTSVWLVTRTVLLAIMLQAAHHVMPEGSES